jgi:prevent-host-death family protein
MIVMMTIMVILFRGPVNHDATSLPTWSIAEAKAKLSELMENAETVGPQVITRNGKPKAVVVSHDDWERSRPRGTLYQLLRSAPADFGELVCERDGPDTHGDVF